MTNYGRIGVLMGGPSTEREISLKSGLAVYNALKEQGCEVICIDVLTDNSEENIRLIKLHRINCAFLALHGCFGEDGSIQGILEALEIPYTGSDVLASRIAMDKIASRQIFEREGLNVPKYKVFERPDNPCKIQIPLGQSMPLVVKPVSHGSSIGLSFVDREDCWDEAVKTAFSFDKRIIVEEYIKGRELTVGILDEEPLPIVEIIPKKTFFDFEAKYSKGMTKYVAPAKLDKGIAGKIQSEALLAHKFLGCFGCSRVDIILDDNNRPVILEINTIPGMTSQSLLPKAAKIAGIEFGELCLRLVELAFKR
ncbi:MAG: D-alanine--D-alanine ligase [Candidatus Omnitrophota bacterium]|nr:D-alanine--D-alanine ligase [Candidatus Omnitrophota bacterium]